MWVNWGYRLNKKRGNLGGLLGSGSSFFLFCDWGIKLWEEMYRIFSSCFVLF